VDEFSRWLATQWAAEEAQHGMQDAASIWWQTRDLGLFSWERDLLESWARFSLEVHATDFVPAGPNASYEFATWLANREPESRTRIEELDLSVRAFNLLRAQAVRFVDQIDVDRLDDPLGGKLKSEIAEKLRRWRGGDGPAGVPARR
jgi:hypothetical protein